MPSAQPRSRNAEAGTCIDTLPGSGVRRRGVWGVLPPGKFWIFRLKNARFLSFETPYQCIFTVDATSRGRTILLFFHACSACIPTGTTSSRKEAGNWLENLRDSQGTPGCCRAWEKKLSTLFIVLVTKIAQLFHNVVCLLRSAAG